MLHDVSFMLGSILDWVVVAGGIVVVFGAVAAAFVLIARVLKRPAPGRPRTRRASGQFDPPAEQTGDR